MNKDKIYYGVYGEGLYVVGINGENNKRVIDTGDGYYNFNYYNNWIFYRTDPYYDINFHMYNINTGRAVEIENGGLLGIDYIEGWCYYYQNNNTYRLNTSNENNEYFCEQILGSWGYEEFSLIDNWIYYFDTNHYLCRLDINTTQSETIRNTPVIMPWWGRT